MNIPIPVVSPHYAHFLTPHNSRPLWPIIHHYLDKLGPVAALHIRNSDAQLHFITWTTVLLS